MALDANFSSVAEPFYFLNRKLREKKRRTCASRKWPMSEPIVFIKAPIRISLALMALHNHFLNFELWHYLPTWSILNNLHEKKIVKYSVRKKKGPHDRANYEPRNNHKKSQEILCKAVKMCLNYNSYVARREMALFSSTNQKSYPGKIFLQPQEALSTDQSFLLFWIKRVIPGDGVFFLRPIRS